jgi:hypothetical protein
VLPCTLLPIRTPNSPHIQRLHYVHQLRPFRISVSRMPLLCTHTPPTFLSPLFIFFRQPAWPSPDDFPPTYLLSSSYLSACTPLSCRHRSKKEKKKKQPPTSFSSTVKWKRKSPFPRQTDPKKPPHFLPTPTLSRSPISNTLSPAQLVQSDRAPSTMVA